MTQELSLEDFEAELQLILFGYPLGSEENYRSMGGFNKAPVLDEIVPERLNNYEWCRKEAATFNMQDHWKTARFTRYAEETFALAVFDQYRNPMKDHGDKDPGWLALMDRHYGWGRKPFGQFKDYYTWTHKAIYEHFVKIVETVPEGFEKSPFDLWMEAFPKWYKTCLKHTCSPTRAMEILSLRLYTSIKGIIAEREVAEFLENEYQDHKLVYFKPAADSYESSDVDGIIYNRDDGSVRAYVSIKCYKAFGNYTLDIFRNRKNKKLPDLYIGFTDYSEKKIAMKRASDFAVITEWEL